MATQTNDVLEGILQKYDQMVVGDDKRANDPTKVNVPKRTVNLAKGEKSFKDVFGFPSSQDHAVRVFKESEWHEDVQEFIPEKDETYKLVPRTTEYITAAIMQGDKVFIHGPTGSGKSTHPEQICAALNIPCVRVNLTTQMEYSALVGQLVIKDGTMSYVFGPLPLLAKHGGVLILDELAAATAEVNMILQRPLEQNGKVFMPDYPGHPHEKYIAPHPWFRIIATDNTELQGDVSGKFVGTNVQNTAMIDRFQTVLRHEYMPLDDEVEVMRLAVPALPEEWARAMCKLARHIRAAYAESTVELTMSTRTLINWARKAVYWGSLTAALRIAWFEKLTDDDRKFVRELVFKHLKKDINDD